MCPSRMRRLALVIAVLAAAGQLAAPADAATGKGERVTELVSSQPGGPKVVWGGRGWPDPAITPDGRHAFLAGRSDLAPGRQLFEHFEGRTTLVSAVASGSRNAGMCAAFSVICGYGISDDASHVYFTTTDPLVADDTGLCAHDEIEGCADIYERFGGSIRRVSVGPTGGNGPFDAHLLAVSSDGTRAFFETAEALVAADTDRSPDVYESVDGNVRLFPSDELAAGDTERIAIHLEGASPDGVRVFFSTQQSLSPSDQDSCPSDFDGHPTGCLDVYERTRDGRVVLVSTGPRDSNDAFWALFNDASDDGATVLFTTLAALTDDDRDTCNNGWPVPGCDDIYRRDLGARATKLVSTGNRSDTLAGVVFNAASADGMSVAFSTDEALLASDSDSCPSYDGTSSGCQDIYKRTPGALELVSTGPLGGNGPYRADFGAMSEDGSRVSFSTEETLTAEDSDTCQAYDSPPGCKDVYQRSRGSTRLISTGSVGGNGPVQADFDGASADGRRVFFHTAESLEPIDNDTCPDFETKPDPGCTDIYERFNGTTTLLSTGPSDPGHCEYGDGHQSGCPRFLTASADGRRVFFGDNEPLVPADVLGPTEYDIYVSKVVRPGCGPNKPGYTPAKCAR